jgi:hypothetical protein
MFDKSKLKTSKENSYTSPTFYAIFAKPTSNNNSTHGPHNKFYSIGNAYGSSASNPYALPNPSAIYESVNQPHLILKNNPIYEKPIYNNPQIYENHIYENPNNL